MGGDPINTPGSHGKAIFVACLIFPPFTLGFLALRLYCRSRLTNRLPLREKFGWDDVVAVITFAFVVAFSILLSLAAHHGFGLHKWQLKPEILTSVMKYVVIFSPTYIPAVAGYKASLLLLYLRLFNSRKSYRWLCGLGLYIVCATAVVNVFLQFLGCQPLEKFWHPKIPGYCIDRYRANAAFAAVYVFSDFYVALLPLPIIWKTQIRTKKKAQLTFVLGVGIIAFLCALVRTIALTIDHTSDDRTYFPAGSPMWSVVEINVGLWTSCVPTFGPLFSTNQEHSSRRATPRTKGESIKRQSLPLKELGSPPGVTWRENDSSTSIIYESGSGTVHSETIWAERIAVDMKST